MGLFEHVATGRRVVGANTHLDDQGAVARREGARLIVRAMGEFVALADADADGAGEGRARGRTHVFLAGDMNSETTGAAYKILNGDESLVRDVREYVGEKERYGDVDTFTGFGTDGEQPTRIDFVFVGKEDVEGVDGYAVLENRFEDGVYCSDHRAVVGDVVLAS
jgi:endonuclease/exonuclease/phosphatase family metal-dependent hydrolase